MKFNILRCAAPAAIALLAACTGNGSVSGGALPAAPQQPGMASSQQVLASFNVRQNCGATIAPDEMRCLSLVRTDEGAPSPMGYRGEDLTRANLGGYGPPKLQAAYGITTAAKTQGKGQLVAIVDAYAYPAAEKDLKVYRNQLGLPPCTKANHCLQIVNQDGQTSPLPKKVDFGWDGEQALDLDMVSAICPNCKIVLVQANSSYGRDLYAGVLSAGRMGASAVSNSYGGGESRSDSTAFDQTGVVITASAGDNGAGASQPCSFRHVVCVGGTSLHENTTPRGFGETVWDGTGSGCSAKVAKPPWQTDTGCTMRSESDIAAVADPQTGVNTYFGGWQVVGGTSASSPIIAAMFALAGNAKTLVEPKALWQNQSANMHDVVSGSNQSHGTFQCPTVMKYICNGGPGYDGPTGWGTPDGLAAL